MLPWIACALLAIAVLVLLIKNRSLKKGMNEICSCMAEHLSSDTNVLISVSSGDKHVRHLASKISTELSVLRRLKHQYTNGDRELKEAVTNISHDLRTPLTAISGYLELLEKEDVNGSTKEYIQHISERTEALKALTEELFRYSIISSVLELSYEKLDIRGVLEDSLLSFVNAFEQKGIKPVISLPDAPIMRSLDRSALTRIFVNIIGNAVKYSDGDFTLKLNNSGEAVFSNSAKELSNVELGKLFDRFYTVDLARKSTGLGLSIAKLLTERMHGTINAEYQDTVLYITVKFNGN